eukprot:7500655-Pyramimonas_sp.AAC.1
MDPDAIQQVPGLAVPSSAGELRPEILAIHEAHHVDHDKVWRLQCGHIFHAQCWGRVAHARADRQLAGVLVSSQLSFTTP